jgi:hypothetical protein
VFCLSSGRLRVTPRIAAFILGQQPAMFAAFPQRNAMRRSIDSLHDETDFFP